MRNPNQDIINKEKQKEGIIQEKKCYCTNHTTYSHQV